METTNVTSKVRAKKISYYRVYSNTFKNGKTKRIKLYGVPTSKCDQVAGIMRKMGASKVQIFNLAHYSYRFSVTGYWEL